jgi:transposase-like protein
VFSPLFADRVNEEKKHHTDRDQHYGILDKKGFDNECFCIHIITVGITQPILGVNQ